MKTLIVLLSLLSYTYSIELDKDNNSNNLRYNLRIDDPEVDSCLDYNETINIKNATEEICTSHVFEDDNYRCCFISYNVGKDYSNQLCKIIAFNKKSIDDVKYSFRHAKKLKILCNEYLINIIYFILCLFLLILLI